VSKRTPELLPAGSITWRVCHSLQVFLVILASDLRPASITWLANFTQDFDRFKCGSTGPLSGSCTGRPQSAL